jgi:hypothetical protein
MDLKKITSGGLLIATIAIAAAIYLQQHKASPSVHTSDATATVQLVFPYDKYPETGEHIKEAIAAGESSFCTIDRKDVDEHRKESLKDVATKKGYDRDEWPMAMCKEGGTGANIKYISPSDNRGAGSWVSNQLEKYPDGTTVEFEVK